MTRVEDALDRYKKGRLTAEEAGELLGLSGRHFRCRCARYAEAGIDGLCDRRLGKASPRRPPQSELDRMHLLYRAEYADFTVKHFHEELHKHHNYHLGYTVTRLSLQSVGLVKPARGKRRRKRPRRPLPGMLLFQDGSTHRWTGALDHDLDLIVTLDDATSHITSAFLFEQEGTMSSLIGLRETIAVIAARTTSIRPRPAPRWTRRI